MSSFQVVLCTCPDQQTAENLARHLVQQQLAACVNIVPGLTSVYRWEGQIESASECLLLIKTAQQLYPELEACLLQQHPYAVPEIIALPITQGAPAYLQWLAASLAA